MGGNDHWIAGLAWFLFSFISVTSQAFIFWPWLFGTTTRISLYRPSIDINPININVPGVPGVDELYDPLVLMETQVETDPAGTVSIVWGNLNVQALLYLVPFNFSLVMLCWNYYLTMTTSPGSPPLDWVSKGMEERGNWLMSSWSCLLWCSPFFHTTSTSDRIHQQMDRVSSTKRQPTHRDTAEPATLTNHHGHTTAGHAKSACSGWITIALGCAIVSGTTTMDTLCDLSSGLRSQRSCVAHCSL